MSSFKMEIRQFSVANIMGLSVSQSVQAEYFAYKYF